MQSDQTESTDIIVRNQSGQDVTIPPDPNFSVPQVVLHPKDFVHAVGPSRPLTGRVLDLDTGEPIAGAVVRAYHLHGSRFHSSREREEFSTRSAADGRYRLTGLPLGKDNRLVAFATGDVPYIPVGHPVDTSQGPTIEQDFRLKRGVWATGRVYDAQTDQPFTGTISYYWFRNRDLERQIPGLFYASVDDLYCTNSKGEFRLPVLPTRGILAFNYRGSAAGQDSIDRFPARRGAEAIAGAEAMGGLKSFPTLPHYLIPGNYERVAEVNPQIGQAAIRVDLPLYAGQSVKIRVVDAGGKPITGCEFYGVNERWGWQELSSAEPVIEDLRPESAAKSSRSIASKTLAAASSSSRATQSPSKSSSPPPAASPAACWTKTVSQSPMPPSMPTIRSSKATTAPPSGPTTPISFSTPPAFP